MLILVLFLGVPLVHSITLPSHWPTCKEKQDLSICLRNAVQVAINDLIRGNRTLGVEPLDPWLFDKFEYNQRTGVVAMKSVARDIVTMGFKNVKVEYVKTDWKTMHIWLSTPQIATRGNYELTGSLLFIPINGNGKYFISMEKFTSDLKMDLETYTKNGEQYLRVKHATLHPNAEHASVHLTNLFNGNKFLGDRMNALMNRNWRIILDTVTPILAASWGVPIKDISNNIFSQVPMKEFV